MDYKDLQHKAENYVISYFNDNSNSNLVYHNLTHTRNVVNAAIQVANHYQLSDRDFFIVVVGAWFHDTGYMMDPSKHEVKGAELASKFLHANQVDEKTVTEIVNAIQSTQLPQSPNNINEQILCDADLFHLGSEDFAERSKKLHEEITLLHHKELSKKEWRAKDFSFLTNHRYHTDYARLLLDEVKHANLDKLIKKMGKSKQDNPSPTLIETAPKASTKEEQPGKGVETMFRITSANNQRLSDMADNKAQILITVNSIILSLIVSLLLRRLEDNPYLVIPTLMLLLVSLSCIIFSILATRPAIPKGTFTKEDVDAKRVNLVFFGNFYNMPLQQYQESMEKVMGDREFLYGTLIKDVYSQGVVLGKKYKFIRTAYNIFMFGLIATVLAYVTSYAVYGKLF